MIQVQPHLTLVKDCEKLYHLHLLHYSPPMKYVTMERGGLRRNAGGSATTCQDHRFLGFSGAPWLVLGLDDQEVSVAAGGRPRTTGDPLP